MRCHACGVAVLLTCVAQVGATEPPAVAPELVVGSVYGKPITAADIGLTTQIAPGVEFDSRDRGKWALMGRISTTFGGPVLNRFVEERKIEATDEEIALFKERTREMRKQLFRKWEKELEEAEQALAAADLPDEERARVRKMNDDLRESLATSQKEQEAEEAEVERQLAALPAEERQEFDRKLEAMRTNMARGFILSWKIERELHRVHGGRVIFQQAGPEALDGRRRLYEAAEKAGDLTFTDPGVRHMFYYYSTIKHLDAGKEALENPWFFREPG